VVATPTFVAAPLPADLVVVRRLAPLAADLTMRCGAFDVPVGVIASATSLEQQESEEARVVRDFVHEDPWAGMGSVHPGGWMLLARDHDMIVIGQREGEVGLAHVVVLERRDGRFEACSMGGWRLSPPDPREQIEASFAAAVDGSTLFVDWDPGQDLDHIPNRVVSRFEISESDTAVHFLLFSLRNPTQSQNPPGFTSGTGRRSTAPLQLSRPLGDRDLLNDFRVPAQRMTVTAIDPHR
jgi:hypothetical protein